MAYRNKKWPTEKKKISVPTEKIPSCMCVHVCKHLSMYIYKEWLTNYTMESTDTENEEQQKIHPQVALMQYQSLSQETEHRIPMASKVFTMG